MTVKLIKIIKNKIIKNKKGNLIKYISKKNNFFKKFGEVYFNEVNLNKTKGWTLHKRNKCLIICILGKLKFEFIDNKFNKKVIFLESNTGKIIIIPPKIWFSFKSIKKKSIIANFIEQPHDDREIKKENNIKNILSKNS